MKTLHSFSLALLTAGALLTLPGCADNDPRERQEEAAQRQKYAGDDVDRDDDEARSHPPHVGMTKEQVRNAYGKPSDINVTDAGEEWVYNPNAAKGLDFVPYYGLAHQITKKRRGGSILFSPDGRVRDFRWKSE